MFKQLVMISAIFLSGCTTVNYTKQSVDYQQRIPYIKTIAVMPVDFKMYQINAGGVREEMDEWSNKAKEMIKDNLKTYLGQHYKNIEFIDEASLKANHYDLWVSQKGLFEAVASSALNHAYPGPNGFEGKIKNFDYTLGPDIRGLSNLTGADALLFVQGFDSVRSTGRFWMEAFEGALLGVYYYYFSALNMGLVDANTGEVLWFKVNNMNQERDFRNPKQVENNVKWFTEDFPDKK